MASTMRRQPHWQGLPAPYALPAGFAALFAVGTVAAALNGRLPAVGVLIFSAIIVLAVSALSVTTAARTRSRSASR